MQVSIRFELNLSDKYLNYKTLCGNKTPKTKKEDQDWHSSFGCISMTSSGHDHKSYRRIYLRVTFTIFGVSSLFFILILNLMFVNKYDYLISIFFCLKKTFLKLKFLDRGL
jgi:hypothetical protein